MKRRRCRDAVLKKDKEFYNLLLKITIPIALQNLISASLNMVDTLMIGQGNMRSLPSVWPMRSSSLNLFLLASAVVWIFVAQFGARDIKNIRRVLGPACYAVSE